LFVPVSWPVSTVGAFGATAAGVATSVTPSGCLRVRNVWSWLRVIAPFSFTAITR
jgi:hypothetical protein